MEANKDAQPPLAGDEQRQRTKSGTLPCESSEEDPEILSDYEYRDEDDEALYNMDQDLDSVGPVNATNGGHEGGASQSDMRRNGQGDDSRTDQEIAEFYEDMIVEAMTVTDYEEEDSVISLLEACKYDITELKRSWGSKKTRVDLIHKAGLQPRKRHPEAADPPSTGGQCSVCLTDLLEEGQSPSDLSHLGPAFECGHRLHLECFHDLLANIVREEQLPPYCCLAWDTGAPEKKCNGLLLDGKSVVRDWLLGLAEGDDLGTELRPRWAAVQKKMQLQAKNAIGRVLAARPDPLFKRCPGDGCGLGVRRGAGSSSPQLTTVRCDCGIEFCLCCRAPPHAPLPCREAGEWYEGVKHLRSIISNTPTVAEAVTELTNAISKELCIRAWDYLDPTIFPPSTGGAGEPPPHLQDFIRDWQGVMPGGRLRQAGGAPGNLRPRTPYLHLMYTLGQRAWDEHRALRRDHYAMMGWNRPMLILDADRPMRLVGADRPIGMMNAERPMGMMNADMAGQEGLTLPPAREPEAPEEFPGPPVITMPGEARLEKALRYLKDSPQWDMPDAVLNAPAPWAPEMALLRSYDVLRDLGGEVLALAHKLQGEGGAPGDPATAEVGGGAHMYVDIDQPKQEPSPAGHLSGAREGPLMAEEAMEKLSPEIKAEAHAEGAAAESKEDCGKEPERVEEDEAKSTAMVQHTSKPCPGCAVPITRSYGCNAMQCSKCRTTFCWNCLGPEHTHGMCVAPVDFGSLRATIAQIEDEESRGDALQRVEALEKRPPQEEEQMEERRWRVQPQPQLYLFRTHPRRRPPPRVGTLTTLQEQYRRFTFRFWAVWAQPLVKAHVQAAMALLAGEVLTEDSLEVKRLCQLIRQAECTERRWSHTLGGIQEHLDKVWEGKNIKPAEARQALLERFSLRVLDHPLIELEAAETARRALEGRMDAAMGDWLGQLTGEARPPELLHCALGLFEKHEALARLEDHCSEAQAALRRDVLGGFSICSSPPLSPMLGGALGEGQLGSSQPVGPPNDPIAVQDPSLVDWTVSVKDDGERAVGVKRDHDGQPIPRAPVEPKEIQPGPDDAHPELSPAVGVATRQEALAASRELLECRKAMEQGYETLRKSYCTLRLLVVNEFYETAGRLSPLLKGSASLPRRAPPRASFGHTVRGGGGGPPGGAAGREACSEAMKAKLNMLEFEQESLADSCEQLKDMLERTEAERTKKPVPPPPPKVATSSSVYRCTVPACRCRPWTGAWSSLRR